MARTVSQIEQSMSIRLGDYITGTASSNGNAGGTTVVTTSNDVLSRAGQSWVPYILELTSGTYSGQYRRVSDYSVTAGVATITVVNAFGGQVVSAVTFRIHRFSPDEKMRAINTALGEMHDVMPRIIFEEVLVGELLRNANLEQWRTNIPYDWEVVTGTVTAETTLVRQGKYSLKNATASGVVRQRIWLERDIENETLVFEGLLYGKKTAGPRLGITANGTTVYSSALAADSTWEKLSKEVEITDWRYPIYAVLDKGSGSDAGYFDALHLYVKTQGSVSIIPISDAFKDIRQVVWRQGIDQDATTRPGQLDYVVPAYSPEISPSSRIWNGYMHYNERYLADHFLQLVGTGVWPTVSATTDSIDMGIDQEPLVAVRAGMRLLQTAINMEHLSDTAHWQTVLTNLTADNAAISPLLYIKSPTKHLNVPTR